MRVLILGARAPAALEWARAFASSGWKVTVGDSVALPLARGSRAAHAFVRLPSPRFELTAWIEALQRVIAEQQIDLVLPTCEETFYLAHARDALPCRVVTADLETMQGLHHKGRFAHAIAGWPIEAPETVLLESVEALCPLQEEPSQWVFKPAYSRFASRTLIRPPRDRLRAVRPSLEQPWVAQRFVAGTEHCSFSLFAEGRLTAHACYRPRHRVGQGSGIWLEPTDPAPVRRFVEHFGTATGYSGQVGFDFIEAEDGAFSVLECNPRATSGVHFFSEVPGPLVDALLGSPGEVLRPDPKARMVALAVLLFVAPRHLIDGAFWRSFRTARDVVARPGDRWPVLTQVLGLTEVAWIAARERRSLLAASTVDIEWDGRPMEQVPHCS